MPSAPSLRRLRAAVRLVFGVCCLALGCTRVPGASGSPRPIEIVVPTAPATLDPRYATDSVAMRVTRLVHAGLIRLDPDSLAPIPYAAQSYRWLDPRTLEVSLRTDIAFHGGKPLTSRDVCSTLEALLDPAVMSPHRAVVKEIARCEEMTPVLLRIVLAGPHATLLTDLEVPILRADQARSPPRPLGDLDGLGPYRIARADASAIELVPADHAALARPAYAVTVRTVHDENARALRLLAGRADIAPNAISPALLPALSGREGLQVRSRPGANVTYLLLQNEHPPFDDPRARRAVGRAIDRELIVRTLLAGRAQIATTFFPPGSIAHPVDLLAEPFDAGFARAALAGAAGGSLTLLVSTDRAALQVARAIAQQLMDAGLPVELSPLDFGVMMHRLSTGDFDLATLQMPELTEPNLLRWFFHSSFIPSAEHPSGGANRARYRSPTVDAWLDQAASEPRRDERELIYAKVARQLASDAPALPLWHQDQIAVVSQRATAYAPSAEGRWLDVASLR